MSLTEKLINLDAAIALVERTPARMINLDAWAVKTVRHPIMFWRKHRVIPSVEDVRNQVKGCQVCLGGLIACDPYFQSLGVKRSKRGAPIMDAHGTYDIAEPLFGNSYLFVSGMGDRRGHKDQALSRLRNQRALVVRAMERAARKPKKSTITPEGLAALNAVLLGLEGNLELGALATV